MNLGLMNGSVCYCFDEIPLDLLQAVNEENFCNSPCSGDSNYNCGGLDSLSLFVAS